MKWTIKQTIQGAILVLTILSGAFFSASSHAQVIWSESFSVFSDGDLIPAGTDTEFGPAQFNNNGTAMVNAAGELALTADQMRDSIQIDSSTGAAFGSLTFDLAFLGDTVLQPDADGLPTNPSDIFFFQLTEGGRSTGGTPIPGFADTLDASQDNISLDPAAPSSVVYFFNGTGASEDYLAPDGTTGTLPAGTYDLWVDAMIENDDSSQIANDGAVGAAIPSQVSTVVVNLFNNQEGEVWNFDNFVFENLGDAGGGDELLCDGDADMDCDLDDLDLLYQQAGTAGSFDLDGSGMVDDGDIGEWLTAASSTDNAANPTGGVYAVGDLDLDLEVSSTDLGLQLNNFGSSAATPGAGAGYGGGDVNIDGAVDSTDLGLLLNNFGFGSTAASAVPEPNSVILVLMALMSFIRIAKRR